MVRFHPTLSCETGLGAFFNESTNKSVRCVAPPNLQTYAANGDMMASGVDRAMRHTCHQGTEPMRWEPVASLGPSLSRLQRAHYSRFVPFCSVCPTSRGERKVCHDTPLSPTTSQKDLGGGQRAASAIDLLQQTIA